MNVVMTREMAGARIADLRDAGYEDTADKISMALAKQRGDIELDINRNDWEALEAVSAMWRGLETVDDRGIVIETPVREPLRGRYRRPYRAADEKTPEQRALEGMIEEAERRER